MAKKHQDDLFEQLRQEFSSLKVPDLKDRIKANYYFNKDVSIKQPKKHFFFNLKYALSFTLASIILVLAIFGINQITPPPINTPILTTEKQLVSFEAFSAISVMPESQVNNLSFTYTKPQIQYLNNYNTEKEIDYLHKYMLLIEQVLAIDEGLKIEVVDSDKGEYTNKEIIEISSAFNITNYYTLYYNIINEEVEDDESEYELQGIMIADNLQYQLYGSKEIESNEVSVSLTAILSNNTWVKVSSERKSNKEEFEYEISDNGVITKTIMEIEKNDKQVEVELEYETENGKSKYRFRHLKEENQIRIQAKDKKNTIVFIVNLKKDEITGQNIYEYKSNRNDQVIQRGAGKGNRNNPNDDDDDEDDEEYRFGNNPNDEND